MDNSSDDNTNHDFVAAHCRVLKITDMKGNTKEMYLPKSLDLERPKRTRTNFTRRQLKELEKAFTKNQYLVGKERKSLSERLSLSEAQIKIWYQNRRTKEKKEKYKEKERMAANAESIATNNIMNLLERQQKQFQHYGQQSSPQPQLNRMTNITPKHSPIQCQNVSTASVNPLAYSIGNCEWNSTSNYLNHLNNVYLTQNLLNR